MAVEMSNFTRVCFGEYIQFTRFLFFKQSNQLSNHNSFDIFLQVLEQNNLQKRKKSPKQMCIIASHFDPNTTPGDMSLPLISHNINCTIDDLLHNLNWKTLRKILKTYQSGKLARCHRPNLYFHKTTKPKILKCLER